MNLLPLELSQNIVDTLADDLEFGLYEFLMLRCVNKLFDCIIVDTISRREPSDFEKVWRAVDGISPTFLTKILKTRLDMDHERKTQLSHMIYGVVDLLVGSEGPLRVQKGQDLINALLEDLGRTGFEFGGRETLDLSLILGQPEFWNSKDEAHAALIAAAATGDIPAMKRMFNTLSEKDDLTYARPFFGGALDAAAFRGQVEATRYLLRIDLRFHYHPNWVSSALYIAAFRSACYAGQVEIVNIALEENDETPNYIITKRDYISFIASAMAGRQSQLVISLLERAEFSKFEFGDRERCQIFKVAAKSGNDEVIATMLKSEDRIETPVFGTALRIACGRGREKVVRLLLDADMGIGECWLNVCLDEAFKRDRFEVIQMLLRHRATSIGPPVTRDMI